MIADSELLGRYAAQKTEADFAELVRRHLNLVYSAALRQVRGDVHLAREVTQSVFNDLSRKAGSLRDHAMLSGWLYTSTRYAALQLLRAESRRKLHEQEAHVMNELTKPEETRDHWDSLRLVLDEVMHGLGGSDREAVLLRFFEEQPFQAIGTRLGLSEEAARKRVERALERLRGALEKRGVTSTAAALAGLLTENGLVAAPTGLGAAVTAGAIGSVKTIAFGGTVLGRILVDARIWTGVAATVAAIGTAIAVSEYRTGRRLEAELSGLRAEQGALTGERAEGKLSRAVQQLEAELVARRGLGGADGLGPLPSEDERMNDPADLERRRASFRKMYDKSYAVLFRSLGLSSEELERFISLMLDTEQADLDARRLARIYGLPVKMLAVHDALKSAATEEILAEMKEMIGAEKFAYYQNYERTLPFRHPLNRLAEQLRLSGTPLSDHQIDDAANLIVSSFSDRDAGFAGGPYLIADAVIAQLEGSWTKEQVEGLRGVQASQKAMREMMRMNREAALKGQLRLNAQSQKDYPGSTAATALKP